MKILTVLLTLFIAGMLSGRLIMWYGGNHDHSLIGTGFAIYAVSFIATFVFALLLYEPDNNPNHLG